MAGRSADAGARRERCTAVGLAARRSRLRAPRHQRRPPACLRRSAGAGPSRCGRAAAGAATVVRRCRVPARRPRPASLVPAPAARGAPADVHRPGRRAGRRPVRPVARRERREPRGPPLARAAQRSAGGAAQPPAQRRAHRCRSRAGQLAVVLGRGHRAGPRDHLARRDQWRRRPPAGARQGCRRGNRDATRLQAAWLLPAVAAVQRREIDRLVLDFEDGARFSLEPGQRWRFWRRPRQALAE